MAAILAVLHGTEVVCERAFVVEEVGAQLTDPVWVSFAEVSEDSVTSLVICLIMRIPNTNSDLVAGDAVRVRYVGNTRLFVPYTLLDNFTSVFSLFIPLRWVPREQGVDPGCGDAGCGCGGRDGGAWRDI